MAMSRWSVAFAVIVVVASADYHFARAYDDDDLLCRPGWSPEILHQQLWQQYEQQRAIEAEHQYAIAHGAAAEQRALERIKSARRSQHDKAARRRDELIAKRKTENAKK